MSSICSGRRAVGWPIRPTSSCSRVSWPRLTKQRSRSRWSASSKHKNQNGLSTRPTRGKLNLNEIKGQRCGGGRVCLGQGIGLGMGVSFARYADSCIYSTWHSAAACTSPHSSRWLLYNWGFSKKLYHPSALPSSLLPRDHHSHHHSLPFFQLIITSSSGFGLFWRFSFSPLGSLSTVR